MGYRTSSIEILAGGALTITDEALTACEVEHEIGLQGAGLRLGAPDDAGNRAIGPRLPSGEEGLSRPEEIEAFLRATKGCADIVITWEGGDSHSGYRVADGTVEEMRVTFALVPASRAPGSDG